jgi:1,4-dihydroxy-2-naphthoyl-CoA hydrolase
MPNNVYFFPAQFSVILGASIVNRNQLSVTRQGIDRYVLRKQLTVTNTQHYLNKGFSTMGIFREGTTVESLNKWSKNTLAEQLGIEFISIGEDFLEARMPVDKRTHQPLGMLHGGASVSLAETMGSVAATLCIDQTKFFCVGLEINANHLKSVREGFVKGVTKPIHIGKKTQVWEIRITTEQGDLVCISRITMAVLEKKN